MRLVFWILVVLNLLLLAGTQGMLGDNTAGREPDRIAQQLKPEQLRIVVAGDTAAVAPPVVEPAPAAAAAPSPAPVVEPACKRIDGLAPAEADSLAQALGDLPDWQIKIIHTDAPTLYWVAIPGLASRAAAGKKRDEVSQLGIKDHEIVEQTAQGPFLVLFSRLPSEAEANELQQGLQKKGVRSARVLPFAAEPKKAVELRAPATILEQKLPELAALFPAATVGDCAAP